MNNQTNDYFVYRHTNVYTDDNGNVVDYQVMYIALSPSRDSINPADYHVLCGGLFWHEAILKIRELENQLHEKS